MIVGRLGNTSGRPYIEGRLSLPRFNISLPVGGRVGFGDISFLADTGADRTTIMPLDGMRLSIPYRHLVNPIHAHGVGGTARLFVEPALVAFLELGVQLCAYAIDILIQEPLPAMYSAPSLLGRDIMSQWILTVDPSHNLLGGKPLRADYTFPAPGSVGLVPVTGVPQPPVHP